MSVFSKKEALLRADWPEGEAKKVECLAPRAFLKAARSMGGRTFCFQSGDRYGILFHHSGVLREAGRGSGLRERPEK